MGMRQERSVFKRDECEYMWIPKWRAEEVREIVRFEKSERLKKLAESALTEEPKK